MLAIPYFADGKCVNVKYRKLWELKDDEEPWLMRKGGKLVFWNHDVITDPALSGEPLIITEGEWDALAAIQAGFKRVVSVPNGASVDGAKALKYLDHALEAIDKVEWIILAMDGDAAGDTLRSDLAIRIGKARCKTVAYPKGCKDFNDVLRMENGAVAIQDIVERARFYPMEDLAKLKDIPPAEPLNPLMLRSLGADFQSHIGFCRGHVSMWTGEPNGGKTTLLRCASWAAAVERGWRTAAAFFEDNPKRDTEKNLRKLYLDGWDNRFCSAEDMADADAWIDEHYTMMQMRDRRRLPTVDWFLEQAEGAVIRHGCDLIIADPWSQFDLGKIEYGKDKGDLAIENLLAIKMFAEDMNVHVAIIAHPRKHGEYGGTTRMADGNDIAGSLHFRARCDLGVTVQADAKVKNVTNVSVWKVRERGEMGERGEFSLSFSPASKRFTGIHPDDLAALRAMTQENIIDLNKRRPSGRRERED